MSAGAPRPWHLVAYTDATEVGGAELGLATVVGGLPDHVRRTVVGVDAEVVEAVTAGAPQAGRVLLAPSGGKLDLGGGLRHRSALAALAPDILHLQLRHPYACQWALVAGLSLPGVRTVAAEQLVVAPANALQARIRGLLDARLDAHVAVGSASGRELERHLGLPSQSIRTIWNGIADPGEPPNRGATPGNRLVFSGRLTEQKGLDTLLRALVLVPDARLRVLGEGPERARLLRLSATLGLLDRVEFAGWTADVRPELAHADVFVLPSRFEALPLSVIEAMLAGLPVVASDVGSVSELLAGDAGLLVAADDVEDLAGALAGLVASPTERRRLGRRARARALAHFTAAKMVRRWLELYEKLLAR